MIPKNAELRANADRAALAKMVVRAGMPRHLAAPPPRRGKGVPQKIEGKGNFLVQNPPKGVQVYPTEAGVQRNLGKRAANAHGMAHSALVAQDGLLPTPGLDQRKMLMPSNRKP